MDVELQNLSKHFGSLKANENISFTFRPGRIYAILGENGAGKSTLMKILSGYQTQTSGQILINGQPVWLNTPKEAIMHGIGMLYQDPLDFAPLTVIENYMNGRGGGLFYARRALLVDFTERTKALNFTLKPHALVESLTVGERQQLEIVRLLSLGVRFLILDEPTTGISAEQKTNLFTTLKHLAHEDNMTIVLVSHKLEDVEELCDELIVLRRGKLVGYEVLPCPTSRMVELMFGKRIEKRETKPVRLGSKTLEIQNLSIHNRLFSIADINLEMRAGEVIGLAGLDGSGQDRFMREITGLERATWGDHGVALGVLIALWLVLGAVLHDVPTVMWLARFTVSVLILGPIMILLWELYQKGRGGSASSIVKLQHKFIGWRGYRDLMGLGVAYLSAGRVEEGLVGRLTIMEHVALTDPRHRLWVKWWGALKQADELIRRFNVIGKPLDPVQNLSGGNQQRVAVALLPQKLSLILMENPTRGLDVESARYVWSLILERRQTGTCIIFSSPDLDEIITYSNRILVFSSGRVRLVEDMAEMNSNRLGELIGGKE